MGAPPMTAFPTQSIPNDALALCNELAAAGHRAWVVGGCVRDVLRGESPADWDLCTSATPEQMMAVFPRAIPTGIAHGTVTVVRAKQHFEITTLRHEVGFSDGRRPDAVHFVDNIALDLARRDFTINAMAVDPRTGELVDPFGGRDDLSAGVIRAVGQASERFAEDGLRVLRAARFAARFGFELEAKTEQAIAGSLGSYRKVSGERVRDEWAKSMLAPKPSVAFELMRRTGILEVTCPELMESVGCTQNHHHSYDVWGHALACLDAGPQDAMLRLAALLHDVGKPRSKAWSEKTADYTFYDHERIGAEMVGPICARLKLSNDERARITDLVRHHMWHYDAWGDTAVRRWIKKVGLERIEDLLALRAADVRGKGPGKDFAEDDARTGAFRAHIERVMAEGMAFGTKDLKIGGRDLMTELGIAPGPKLKVILEALLEQVIEEPSLNERDALLARARKLA